MNGKIQTDILKDLNSNDSYVCTKSDLEDYINSGLIFKSSDKYYTRNGKELHIKVVKSKNKDFDFDLSDFIFNAMEISSEDRKIYFMSESLCNFYKSQNLIVEKNNNIYYRLYQNELWRIILI